MARVRSELRWKLALMGGVVLIMALVFATSLSNRLVGAQTSTSTPTTDGTSTASAPYQEIANQLAQQFGIDPAQVEAVLEQVLGSTNMNMNMSMVPTSELKDLASALNLPNFFGESSSALNAELDQGMTLAEIAQSHGKTAADLSAYLTQQFTGIANSIIGQLFGEPAVQSVINQLINVPLTMPSNPATPAS